MKKNTRILKKRMNLQHLMTALIISCVLSALILHGALEGINLFYVHTYYREAALLSGGIFLITLIVLGHRKSVLNDSIWRCQLNRDDRFDNAEINKLDGCSSLYAGDNWLVYFNGRKALVFYRDDILKLSADRGGVELFDKDGIRTRLRASIRDDASVLSWWDQRSANRLRCPACGAPVIKGQNYCEYCGSRLTWNGPAEVQKKAEKRSVSPLFYAAMIIIAVCIAALFALSW